jgi:hypothetical protein
MENHAEVQVDIRQWADQIRQIKITELQEVVNKKRKDFDVIVAKIEAMKTNGLPKTNDDLLFLFNAMKFGLQLISIRVKLEKLKKATDGSK